MTAGGLQRLEEELRHLKGRERPAIIRAIAEARTHGDLSENAEYHAARERQSFIEGRIAELEEITNSAEVIDPSQLSGDNVKFGAHVWVVEEDSEKEFDVPDRRPARGGHQERPDLRLLAARQGADRPQGGRYRFGAGAERRSVV